MSQPLSQTDELDLLRLAAELILGEGFRPDGAVTKAVDLVAKGVEGEATLSLAMQPADPRSLDGIEVRALFQAMLHEQGLELVAPADGGWVKARWIAELMLTGAVRPAVGASRLGQLWHVWRRGRRADLDAPTPRRMGGVSQRCSA